MLAWKYSNTDGVSLQLFNQNFSLVENNFAEREDRRHSSRKFNHHTAQQRFVFIWTMFGRKQLYRRRYDVTVVVDINNQRRQR